MYNIGICDDAKNSCAFLEDMILQYATKKKTKVEIAVWYSGEHLVEYLKQGNHIDILFLDIELLEISGIEVADFIRNKLEDREMQIIYISGKGSYAQELFKTQPMDFLVKPFTLNQIKEVLDLAIKILGRNSKTFKFQRGKDFYCIPCAEIMYFVSEGRKIRVMTSQGEKIFYGKLKDIINELPEDFISIHQSYVINKNYVLRYAYDIVELTNGTTLTISKVNRKIVREKILREG